MAKRKKKTPKQLLIAKCEQAFNRIVRDRDGHCQRCGGSYILQVHHVVRQSRNKRMTVDPVNGLLLCRDCHSWWHHDDTLAGMWFANHWPDRSEYLEERHMATKGLGWIQVTEWEATYEELENWATDTLEPRAIQAGIRPRGGT